MKTLYTTGEFAKMANVTIRTIRYYDEIDLLKPSYIAENGYRKYCNDEFIKLQKIISLKQLGFSLEDIRYMVQESNLSNFEESIQLQIDLINQKISHYNNLKDSLYFIKKLVHNKEDSWQKVIELIRLSNFDDDIIEQYKNSKNLNSRISLHEQFSTNPIKWFPWLYQQIDFSKVNRLLEVGCGNGELWKHHSLNLRNREIFLSDRFEGMVEQVKKELGNDFNCMVIHCENIPFKDNYFDAIIANHMLFYLKDLNLGLSEIKRVIRHNGIFYCTTYGLNHMKEITEIVQSFDKNIILSNESLPSIFGLENGKEILSKYFNDIKLVKYNDTLKITESKPLIDYILSCHGNQNEIILQRMKEFNQYIDAILKRKKVITVTKDVGLFICTNK